MLQNDPVPNISAQPTDPNNLFSWQGTLRGPPGSPYEGGLFYLDIAFPQNYPIKPPKVRFQTKVYHPNIDKNGAICLDTLYENWNPSHSASSVLLTIGLLMVNPEVDDPLCPEVASLYKANINAYNQNARAWT